MSATRLPPYLIAGGRTRPSQDVAIEALVERTSDMGNATRTRFESARILELSARPTSVAEIANVLRLPLGATVVLVADLLEDGALVSHHTVDQSELSDREIMTRIIHRVREL